MKFKGSCTLHSPKILFSTFYVGKGSRAQPYPAVTIMNNFITSTYQKYYQFMKNLELNIFMEIRAHSWRQLFQNYFETAKYFYSAITLYFDKYIYYNNTYNSVGGSVVECSPATRATRVRFPADANFYPKTFGHICKQLTINVMQALFISTLLQKQLRFWNYLIIFPIDRIDSSEPHRQRNSFAPGWM
ncbi:hypothetical protein T02_5211 [Trichinella nativa]|uniref:Uncharacterized protein n=1 Tax=Trichinella nativa TaxID=6335 RepID=A0A0V1KQH7_9BILA|nr:hypothetical protein T02_5211 [Trichinella nativa]